MDDDAQQFSLRWHNHQGSVVGALGQLLRSGALSDVTLCAAGASLRAHRVVLAACSQYFAQMFRDVEAEGAALVVLAGCGAAELRLLLTFMYTGEVTAPRARLPALLALARTLRVSGLADTENNLSYLEPEPLNLEKAEPEPEMSEAADMCDRDRVTQLDPSGTANGNERDRLCYYDLTAAGSDRDRLCSLNASDVIRNDRDRRLDFEGAGGDRLSGFELSETAAGSDRDRLSRLDRIVQSLYSHQLAAAPAPGPESAERKRNSTCGICHKRLSNQYNLRVHMDTHAGRRHACRACAHVSRSRDALRKHVAYRHARTDHARDAHARDAHARDAHARDAHARDAHARDAHARDAHARADAAHGLDAIGRDTSLGKPEAGGRDAAHAKPDAGGKVDARVNGADRLL